MCRYIAFLFFFGSVAYGQNKSWLNDPIMFDSVLLSNAQKTEFAKLYNSNLGNGIGNYASFAVDDAKVDFSANYRFNNGDIFGVKVNGGISDGLTSIYSNNKWNSSFGLDLSYNFFWEESFKKPADKKFKYKVDYSSSKRDKLWLSAKEIDLKLQKDTIALMKTKKKMLSEIDSLNGLKLNKDSVYINAQIGLLKYKIMRIDSSKTLKSVLLTWADTINKISTSLSVANFKFHWLSVSYGINSNAFKRYDATKDFSNQVWKEDFVSHKIRLQYQWYQNGGFIQTTNKKEFGKRMAKFLNKMSHYYFSIYLEGGERDNFSDLTGNEILEQIDINNSNNLRRSESKYTAYSGDYIKNMQFFNIGADLYWYAFWKNRSGIHFSPKYRGAEGLLPELDFKLGIFSSFKNEKKDGPVLNAEIFVNLTNLMKYNQRDIEPNHFKRADYGIMFTFPINFKN